jgi:hypothetical protein
MSLSKGICIYDDVEDINRISTITLKSQYHNPIQL